MDYYFAGGLLRICQILIDASIWIAFGCVIAAIFRNMIGAVKTRALFGNDTHFGLLIGWAVGMLLPVCSLGVIPVVRELHRVGVKPGTIVAFGLTAPLFNPLSVLYGLSLSDPIAIIVFSATAMIIVTVMGAVWGRYACRDLELNEPEDDQLQSASGLRRSFAVVYDSVTELSGPTLGYIALGVLVSTTLAALIPHGALQGETEPDKLFAPAIMAAFVTPIYSTPLLTMSQIGGMFQHGNSVGAAFSLLILGAGINFGLLFWFFRAFGFGRFIVFLTLLFTLTIGLAYLLDKPLYPEGVTPSGHTHAFDIYTHPYATNTDGILKKTLFKVNEHVEKHGSLGIIMLATALLIGLLLRVLEPLLKIRRTLGSPSDDKIQSASGLNTQLPAWLIGVVACVLLISTSILGAYVYYPPPGDLLDDLSSVNGQCVIAAKTGDWQGVRKWVPYCDDLSRRLEVGQFLRTGSVSEFKRAKAKAFRDQLDLVRDNIDLGLTNNIDQQAMDLHRLFLQLRKAFRDQ